MAASISVSSMFSVSGRMSTNTGVAPRSTNALAVETNVNDGMITSSPGPMSSSSAAISSAAVHEVREQRLRRTDPALEPGLAPSGEASVAGELPGRDGLLDVRELATGEIRAD